MNSGSTSRPGRAGRGLVRALLVMPLAALCACNPPAPADPGLPLSLDERAPEWRAGSCAPDVDFLPPTQWALAVDDVALSDVSPGDLPGAVFAGGWHLRSAAPGFGGLSGLASDPHGNLLAISDQGAFVWIELVDGVPASARLAPMRDAAGRVLTGKRRRDAEGLDLHEGMALVSFERDHRVLAFDLAGCGAAARGVEVARLDGRISGLRQSMAPNGGAEGLVTTARGEVMLALEMTDGGLPLAWLSASGAAHLAGRIEPRGAPVLTGLDRVDDTYYAVLRSYSPGTGNVIEVVSFPRPAGAAFISVRRILRLAPRHGTDNFEGIALTHRDDGGLRLFLVSDDNFSTRQRTLLYAFDLLSPAPATAR